MMKHYLRIIVLYGSMISCLKETKEPLKLSFSYNIVSEQYVENIRVAVDIKNESSGAEGYVWSFSGAEPSSSSNSQPGQIIFSKTGIQTITLKAWNLLGDTQTLIKEIEVFLQMPTPSFTMKNISSDYPPVSFTVTNTTADYPHHTWYFAGSNKPMVNDDNEVIITYTQPGEYYVTLYLTNGKHSIRQDTVIRILPDIVCDFSYTQPIYDVDMEAPFILQTINKSISYTDAKWSLGSIQSSSSDTIVRFSHSGDYPLILRVNNDKKTRSCSTLLHLNPNSGIWILENIKLAANMSGVHDNVSYFSSQYNTSITDIENTSLDSLKTIDIVLYRPNGDMNHLDFLSASATGLVQVPSVPQASTAIHIVQKAKQHNELQHFTLTDFQHIATQGDLEKILITVPNEAVKQPLTTNDLPCFVFIEFDENRKAVFYLKKVFLENGTIGVLADVKISKRVGL